MISLSRLSQRFCGISFALLTSFSVVTFSVESEGSQLKINPRVVKKEVKENFELEESNLHISANTLSFKDVFQEFDVEGSIIIYDSSRKKVYEHNSRRNFTAFLPASTFKILNTLIALETGVIQDDVSVLTWDGIKRDFDVWNQDTNLRKAFKNSTVWFYQVLARKIGNERMQEFVNQVGYGNRRIGKPENIDNFWLKGDLRITPRQQIRFLQKVRSGKLPFSKRNLNLLKDIMIVEKTPNYILRGKTGWVNKTGWFVGYLEQNNQVYYFATNIEMTDAKLAPARIQITRRCLKRLGLL
ncbi:peptidoglycan glycosyltransferase [Calothrix parasitica NIES-267]|uniref:Beta-lactamase n=1 Tax=Calothrix parasitica NIES-267 TaxID=1973488 RepID=A0A1Z4LXE5_9CYAN|nr:peptidoglycan glycosyltransferase [Calothrix parasitica NIES-267]